MENNLNNLPPFYVGQKVVCSSTNSAGTVSIGKIYPILCIKQADCCGVWIVDVGVRTNYDMTVCSCGYECKHDNTYLASRFAPLQESVFPSLKLSQVVEKERELISMK